MVFNTALDLKAHIVEEHGGDMSARDKKNVSRIQADFAFEEVGYGSRHGRRDRERDRDPPPRQPQPQAESSRGAQNAGARRREAFSGALTTEGSGAAGSSSNHPSRGASRPTTPPGPTDVDPAVAAQVFLPYFSVSLWSNLSRLQ